MSSKEGSLVPSFTSEQGSACIDHLPGHEDKFFLGNCPQQPVIELMLLSHLYRSICNHEGPAALARSALKRYQINPDACQDRDSFPDVLPHTLYKKPNHRYAPGQTQTLHDVADGQLEC